MFRTFEKKFEKSEPLWPLAIAAGVAGAGYYLYKHIVNDNTNWNGVSGTEGCPGSLGLKNDEILERHQKAIQDTIEDRKIDYEHLDTPQQEIIDELVELTLEDTCIDLFDGQCAFITTDASSTLSSESMVIKGASSKYLANDLQKISLTEDTEDTVNAYTFGEDCALVIRDHLGVLKVAVVFDGHGGHSVSQYAIREWRMFATIHNTLQHEQNPIKRQYAAVNAYKDLNNSILNKISEKVIPEAGTTMVALFFTSNTVHCLSAGDSFANIAIGDQIYKMGYIDDYDNVPIGWLVHNFGNTWTNKGHNNGVPFKGWEKNGESFRLSDGFRNFKAKYKTTYPSGCQGFVKQIERIGLHYYECNPMENWGFRGNLLQICSSLGDQWHITSGELNKERCFYSEVSSEVGCTVRFAMGSDGVGDWLFPHETVPPSKKSISVFVRNQWELMQMRLDECRKPMEDEEHSSHDDMTYIVGNITLGNNVKTKIRI